MADKSILRMIRTAEDKPDTNASYYVNKEALAGLLEQLKSSAANSNNPLLGVMVSKLIQRYNVEIKNKDPKAKELSSSLDEHKTISNLPDDLVVDMFHEKVDESIDPILWDKKKRKTVQGLFSLTGKDLKTITNFNGWLRLHSIKDKSGASLTDDKFNICYVFFHLHSRAKMLLSKSTDSADQSMFKLYLDAMVALTNATHDTLSCVVGKEDPESTPDKSKTTQKNTSNSPTEEQTKTKEEIVRLVKALQGLINISSQESVDLLGIYNFMRTCDQNKSSDILSNLQSDMDQIDADLYTINNQLHLSSNRYLVCNNTYTSSFKQFVRTKADADLMYRTILSALNRFVSFLFELQKGIEQTGDKDSAYSVNTIATFIKANWITLSTQFLNSIVLGMK
jgi:hypothetical protein